MWSTTAFKKPVKQKDWQTSCKRKNVNNLQQAFCFKPVETFFMRCRETIYNSTSGKHSHYYTQSREYWSQRFHKKPRKCRTKFSTPHSLNMIYLFYAQNFIRFTYFLELQFPHLTKMYRMIFSSFIILFFITFSLSIILHCIPISFFLCFLA